MATVDLPVLAQVAPGERLRFAMIALVEAQALDAERARAFADFEDRLRTARRS